MKLTKNNIKGFSLIELVLVLGLSSLIFLGLLSIEKRRTETLRAEAAGQQFEEVGKALSSYISSQKSQLSATLAPNTSSPNLPITLLQGVSFGAYNGRQYLPTSYNPINSLGTGYRIQIRNNGGNVLTGMVLSDAPVVDESGSIRYDWLGYAARKAGAQSGMSFFTGALVTGLNAGWTVPSTDFNTISIAGQLAYRSQFQGNFDDLYLRRDGLFPMTGNLDMANHNIKDATDINFIGFLNGNNALLNNLQTAYILNNGNIQNNGNMQNNGQIMTKSIMGLGHANSSASTDYATFSRITADFSLNTQFINRESSTDVTIGPTGNEGRLFVKDIFLKTGVNGRAINNWISDRLPRYSSRGIAFVDIPGYLAISGVTVAAPANCPAGTGYKIEVIPQSMYVQGRVMGPLTFYGTLQGDGTYAVNQYQDQFSLGGIQAYATGTGPWQVFLKTPDYYGAIYMGGAQSPFVGGTALAHLYCDFGT